MRFFLLLSFVFLLSPDMVEAVDIDPSSIILVSQQPDIKEGQSKKTKSMAGVHPNDMPSLLFTYWEHIAVKDARRSRGLVRAPTESELSRDLRKDHDEERIKPPPEERDVRLGGILYTSSDNWTIWLNGNRVQPNAIPREIIDILVYDDYIELKWFDEWSNQVFPIRLRSHQRFNIDTRIFLPG